MPRVAIITDSDSSLPPALAQKYNIPQVPITIHFDEESYTTNVDINDFELFELIDRKNKLPTTAAPAPGAFQNVFQAAIDNGYESIICLTVSSKVSATYNAAMQAAEMFPEKDITVVDSLNLSMGQGLMVLQAAKKAYENASKEEILDTILDVRNRLHVFAVLPTLKYLAMGGRVGKLAAGFADAFNIKPILTVKEGKLDLLEKVRTQKKAETRLIELLKESVQNKRIEKIAMIHVNNISGVQNLFSMVKENFECPDDVIFAEFTAGLSVHAGSGVVGYAILTEN